MWRERTATVLVLYLVLAAFGYAIVPPVISGPPGYGLPSVLFDTVTPSQVGGRVAGFAITAFLVWRVSRGGYVSWAILFVLRGVSATLAGLYVLAGGGAVFATVFALSLTGLVLLVSPAARARLWAVRQG